MQFLKVRALKFVLFPFVLFLAIMPFRVSAQSDTGNSRVYMLVPQMPTFAGNLDTFMSANLHYPQSAIDAGASGTVNVTFVITKIGQVTSVGILSGVSPDIDSEAVRVVRLMPPWNPGKKDGVPVNVQYNLPVYFVLDKPQNNATSHAQHQEPTASIDTVYHLRDGFYVEPYIGYGLGGPNSSNANNTQITPSSNFKFGAGFSYMFASNLGISLGLQIQQFNFKYTYSNVASLNDYYVIGTTVRTSNTDSTVYAGYGATLMYSFTYAQVPLLCKYISSQENRPGFYAEAGVVFNYLVSSQISGSATQTEYILNQPADADFYNYSATVTNTQNISTPSQNATKLTTSIHGGIGALIPFNTKISLIVAFSYNAGIMNAGDGSKDEVNFGASKFYYYGTGNYGTLNSLLGEVKVLIKLSNTSHAIPYN